MATASDITQWVSVFTGGIAFGLAWGFAGWYVYGALARPINAFIRSFRH